MRVCMYTRMHVHVCTGTGTGTGAVQAHPKNTPSSHTLGSDSAATATSATRSRDTSPLFSVSSPDTRSAPVGGFDLSPPGRTMVYSRPDARRYFSATSFSSRTPPKAFVMTKPGDFSWPQARPLVRIDDTITT